MSNDNSTITFTDTVTGVTETFTVHTVPPEVLGDYAAFSAFLDSLAEVE